MKKNTTLPIDASVFLFLEDEHVLEEARQISIHGKKGGRSREYVATAAVPGLAVQYAVAEHLQSLGYTVEPPPPGVFHYDMIVNGVFVDVKCRFSGKYFEQSEWEARMLETTGDRVLYFCVDALPTSFVFKGICWSENLQPSSYGCPYVAWFEEMFEPT